MIKVILICVLLIYMALMMFANIKNKDVSTSSKMVNLLGMIVLFLYLIFLLNGSNVIILLTLGLVLIIISCIMNGFTLYGKIHIKHHIIRTMFSVILIILFYFYGGC